jgi:spore cortex biosynthesis protein YabQ
MTPVSLTPVSFFANSAGGENAVILSMSGQAVLFLLSVAMGAGFGIFFDFFRILRKTVPFFAQNTFIVQLEDFLFWIIVTGGMFYFMLSHNFGEIRLFSMLGAACGFGLYFATLSRLVMLVFVSVIEFLKKVVVAAFKIIIAPLKILFGWLSPPVLGAYKKVRSGLCRLFRYGKIRTRKISRSWFIIRKKV